MSKLFLSKVNGIQKWGGKTIFRSLLTIALFSQASTIIKADDTEGSVGVPSTTTSITVGDLAGIAPSKDVCTTDKPTNDNTKIFFLYNIGTGKFLSPGGFWGTHTSLSDVGFKMWLEANNSGSYDSFNLRTTLMTEEDKAKQEAEVYRYVKYNDSNNSLYMDHDKSVNNGYANNYAWYFVPVTENGYTENSHVYRLYTKNADGTKTIYMTANPTNSYPNYVTGQDRQTDKNQYWKLISLQEYYTLFAQTPAQLKSPTDATFLLKDPSFHVNNAYIKNWEIQNNQETFRFGGTKCNKLIDGKEYSDYGTYQQNDGLYFFAFSKNGNNDGIRQIVPVHQPGWYIIDCNGFSSANTSTSSNVMLYVTPTDEKGQTTKWEQAHATPLNVVSDEEAKSLMENESDNIGNNQEAKVNGEVAAGKAFAEGKYENQVMFYVEKATETEPTYLQFGINIADHTVSGTEWTAFGDFRMYYAGKRSDNTPDLILDEEKNDLSYLTTTNEDYDNVTLHLNRTFTLGKWNTLVLPVNLTYGQMKKAFGDGIKLAKLWKLTDNSIQFKTVECSNDDDKMLNAFEPYIIQVFNGKDVTPAYTATLTKKDNGTLDITIEKDHYDISMVSLKRSDIETNVHIAGDASSEAGQYNWTSKFTGEGTTGTGTPGTLTCYSSMGKTYSGNTITTGYDNLAGAYFMKNGALWKVPSDKQYGMKAFRCWFRLTGNTDKDTDKTSPAKEAKIWLDGVVEDNSTTGIDDIIFDDPFDTPTTYKATENAIYNLNGQLIRQGTSTEGLPSGIYVVAGRKVMIK